MNPKIQKNLRVFVLLVIVLLLCVFTIHLSLNTASAEEDLYVSTSLNSDTAELVTPESSSANNLNCRYGVGGFGNDLAWLSTLRAGWHVTFTASTPYVGESEHVGVIRVSQDRSGGQYLNTYTTSPALTSGGLGALIAASPGKLWLIGNEPDVADVQDDTYPAMYARIYHDVYHFIKDQDPSAQVGIGGLSMATPGRLQYLDIVWNTYLALYHTPMPVDVWNIHIYILSEYNPGIGPGDGRLALGTDPALAKNWPISNIPYSQQCPLDNIYCRAEHDDPDIFVEQIEGMRLWMKNHGQQDKPLIISEYGSLYPFTIDEGGTCFLSDEFGNCFTPTRVSNYLFATMEWLEEYSDPNLGYAADGNRLVQQWLWFSTIVDAEASGASSNLLKDDFAAYPPGSEAALTQVGQSFVAQVSSYDLYTNLYANRAASVTAHTVMPGDTADVDIRVHFVNNGNQSITQPFTVTFYQNASLTQVIGAVTVNPELMGCARESYDVSVTWQGLAPGTYNYWAKLDTGNVIGEEFENDNVTSGVVIINPANAFLPIVQR